MHRDKMLCLTFAMLFTFGSLAWGQPGLIPQPISKGSVQIELRPLVERSYYFLISCFSGRLVP